MGNDVNNNLMPRVRLALRSIGRETYGNWGKQAHDTFSRLASFLVIQEIYGRLNVVLVRSIARAILARELPPSQLDGGKPAALDITVTSLLTPAILGESS